ncbi:MAG: hypothetical protein FWE78_05780, partial [Methanimicrococcus sp.]|nr:hypothetical protein [Methanimicrococcus sp.]
DDDLPTTMTETVDIVDSDVTVYAVWGYDTSGNGKPDISDEMYKVEYKVNGGNANGPADDTNILNGTVHPLSLTGPTHNNATYKGASTSVKFVGWSENPIAKILEAGDDSYLSDIITTVTINGADEEVYAVWGYDTTGNGPDVKANKYEVEYDVNGGNADGPVNDTNIPDGAVHTLSTTGPTHNQDSGFAVLFAGWSTIQETNILSKGDALPATMTTTVTITGNDVTVYAIWSYDKNGDGVPDIFEKDPRPQRPGSGNASVVNLNPDDSSMSLPPNPDADSNADSGQGGRSLPDPFIEPDASAPYPFSHIVLMFLTALAIFLFAWRSRWTEKDKGKKKN